MGRNKITTPMRQHLLSILNGDKPLNAGQTELALVRHGLLDKQKRISNEGWIVAIEASSLAKQCSELGLELRTIEGLDFRGFPEIAAYEYFRAKGYIGTRCEGGAVLVLIRAAALDYLHEINIFSSRHDACSRFTEAQLFIHRDRIDSICAEIKKAKPADIAENFREIYANLEIESYYPDLNTEKIQAIASALSMERLAMIARAIAVDPYTFRNGWPDLTLVDANARLSWVEVKTTDRLHYSQIRTLSTMLPLLKDEVLVVRLV